MLRFGSLDEIKRIVAQILTAWPEVKILLTMGAGLLVNLSGIRSACVCVCGRAIRASAAMN